MTDISRITLNNKSDKQKDVHMSFNIDIRPVVDNLKTRRWIQGTEVTETGAVCAHGAVMTCKGLVPGDERIIRIVMSQQGLTEKWNDAEGRTKDEVLDKLSNIEITDAALAKTFGPEWEQVVAVTRRAAVLTSDELKRLKSVRAEQPEWMLRAARATAWAAAWDYKRATEWGSAWDAAGGAAGALVVRDLIAQHGFTQQHYDVLTGPWATVIGRVHPDDRDRLGEK